MSLNFFTFRSLTHPQKYGYKVFKSYSDFRPGGRNASCNGGICDWAGAYDTYGDGMCQHSPDVPVGRPLFGDFLGSLADYLLTTAPLVRNECLEILSQCLHWPRVDTWRSRQTVRWAMTLRYKEGKTQYYCVNERKVSTADSKSYDKRWEKVASNDDGSIGAVCATLKAGGNCLIETVMRWQFVREVFRDEDVWIPHDWLKKYLDLEESQICGAFDAVDHLVK